MTDRPPFILAFCADQQGCGFHRVMMPLASLVEAGVADGRIDMAIWPDELGVACDPDVVVWQRQVEDSQIEAMARWRKALPKAVFVYELDDYLDDIPATSFHASFMLADIKDRIVRALVNCDRISTTTQPMAVWLKELAPEGCRIDVIPNALPVARLRERKARTTGKLRVGFAGGISHAGDLALLRSAMEAIGDEVTWVFFGLAIEDPPVAIEFHDGVPATLYLDKMLSLDFDLLLAPLVDNAFNRCKSNLRLVEAAAVGAAVIAQDLPPYKVDKPPVFAYADTDESWTDAIRRFIAASRSERQRSVDGLRTWAGRHYTLERLLAGRITAWLPDNTPFWRPSPVGIKRLEKLIVACSDIENTRLHAPFLSGLRQLTDGLESACRTALTLGTDLLWLRPSTIFDKRGFERLKMLLADESGKKLASVVPLATDGANCFPHGAQWSPFPADLIETVSGLAVEQFGDRVLWIKAPTGPVIGVSVQALAALGLPDVAGCDGNEEQALMEWGLRASTRGWKHGQVLGMFAGSLTPPAQPTQTMALRLQARGFSELLQAATEDAALTPDERALLELHLLKAQWGGPRPGSMGFANDYDAWSLLRQAQSAGIKRHCYSVPSVYVRKFGAKKDWPEDAYVVFMDDTITLTDAEYQFEEALQEQSNLLVLYGDNDTVRGGKASPEFKPDFDLTLFLAQDYVTPVCAVYAGAITEVPANRTELFSLILQLARLHGAKRFYHVPRILGAVALNSEPETIALETLERQLAIESAYGGALTVTANRHIIGCLTVTWNWQRTVNEAPLVSIVIPTLGSGRLIQPCVATILQHTAYPNYEVIVVQNGRQRGEPELTEIVRNNPRVRVVYYDKEFNWSEINNWAIRVHALGQYIVTLNDDTCVGTKLWLDYMMGHALQPDVGVVGAKLVHPMGVVQHVGVICDRGIAGHMHKGISAGHAGHLGRILLSHEAEAVTGACMLFSRETFDTVGGFDCVWSHNYNDTVFCLEQRRRGLRNVVEVAAELVHPEASTRPDSRSPAGKKILLHDNARLARFWPGLDSYWNPNMAIAVNPDGMSIQGLNADILAWTDFKPQITSKRILLVNDMPGTQGLVLETLYAGNVPFMADLSGFSLRLSAPAPLNIQPWDIRDSKQMARDLQHLGINRIVVRSLVGATGAAPPVEALRALNVKVLGIEIEIRPVDYALVAPWLVEDGRINEQKMFGYVNMDAWKAAYQDIVGESKWTI